MRAPGPEPLLRFDPLALERCFVAADVLLDDYGDAESEYALLGLATEDDPLRVVATPLLPGQRVTRSTVDQSGYDVLRMRREIQVLSQRMGRRLVPICFVHRHPQSCTPSRTDLEFLCGVFVDQVFTWTSFAEHVPVGPGAPPCACPALWRLWREAALRAGPWRDLRLEYAVGFSLIVNRAREHVLLAARVDRCPACRARSVRLLPARLAVLGPAAGSPGQQAALRARLADEIATKIEFVPASRELAS